MNGSPIGTGTSCRSSGDRMVSPQIRRLGTRACSSGSIGARSGHILIVAIDLPPPVPGNPGAMRALAGQLRTIAEGAGGAIASVETAAGGLDFKGPAATRLHAAISAFGARGRGAASELHD